MSVKTEQKQRSYEAIVASASRLLRERGIGGAKVADVMHGAGLTVGGFYAHFASKESLVDEALRATAREMRAGLFAGLGEGGVERVLRRYLSAVHRDETTKGCPFPAVVGEVGTHAPEHREVLAEQLESMVSALAETVARPSVIPVRHVALGLVALMFGGLSLARATRGTPLSDEMLRACRAVGALAARAAEGTTDSTRK